MKNEQLRRMIREVLDAREYVVIGNYGVGNYGGLGNQVAWPSIDAPGLYTQQEAQRIVRDINDDDPGMSVGYRPQVHWHVKHIDEAPRYAPYVPWSLAKPV